MRSKISLGKISYINASPVYHGLDNGLLPDWLTMVSDVPSALNHKIITDQIEIAPISSAFYAMNHDKLLLLPDLSISCHGDVLSVICASNYELDDLNEKTVMFSHESASSVSFLKMIFSQRQVFPKFKVGQVGNIDGIPSGVDAVMVIGDNALTQPWRERYLHCFDLGGIWYEMTGLPLVFAVWVVRKSFAKQHPDQVREVHELLLASKKQGYAHIDEIIEAGSKKLNLSYPIIKKYYDLLICDLDPLKIKAMKIFFESLYGQKILDTPAKVRFFNS
ncbi:MAG: menaquinone biosynthesis protein [Desulfobacteraceae bacterium]|nr:menaquinone biosynthesis protein [Desulfobacteraceae bacterium]